jgi:hypothetical protein
MTRLPPELEHLGDALGVAIARSTRRRARQDRARRVLPVAVAGALTCFAVAPVALEPAERRFEPATLVPRSAAWSELCAALPTGPAQLCTAFGSDRSDAAAREATDGRAFVRRHR